MKIPENCADCARDNLITLQKRTDQNRAYQTKQTRADDSDRVATEQRELRANEERLTVARNLNAKA